MIGKRNFAAAVAGVGLLVAPVHAREPLDRNVLVAREGGVFAGARLRLPLGSPRSTPPRLSLVAAPLVQNRALDAAPPARIGEGLALQFGEASPPRLTLGGRALSGRGAALPEQRRELSTVATVAVVVGGLALLYVAAVVACQETNCTNSD